MRTLAMTLALATAALVSIQPALAGRDETQIRLTQRAVEAKRAVQLAQQQQVQQGLAGATGVAGKVGPTSEQKPQTPMRAGRPSLSDHP